MNRAGRNIGLNNLSIRLFLVIGILIVGSCSFAAIKEYDGIWFLGMNTRSTVLKHREARQAVNAVIDREHIARTIMSSEVTPAGIVPNGMLGYDPDMEPVEPDLKYAKLLMLKADLPINDQRLKNMSLLHTDGIKTVAIANKIKNDLRAIGIKIKLVEVPYQNEADWVEELASGQHDFFLLGYKAGIDELLKTEKDPRVDSYDLLEPLFQSEGAANFTGYSNPEVDKLLEQLTGLDIALKSERHKKLKQINQILNQDLPAVVLFYIEKI